MAAFSAMPSLENAQQTYLSTYYPLYLLTYKHHVRNSHPYLKLW